MATFTKQLLSGSTQGKQIKVAATATPGTTLHTAVAGTSSFDEVWLYATNSNTVSVDLTIEWGGVAVPDDDMKITIPPNTGRTMIVDGKLLQNGLVIKGFASVANVILIDGFANRIA